MTHLSLDIFEEIGLSMYKDIEGISNSKNEETLNALLFDRTMRYYKERLDVNIIIPQLPKKPTEGMISGFFKAVKTKVYDSFNKDYKVDILNDTDSTKYFGDFTTSDTLDSVITEIPVEIQLLKEESCGELIGINSRIISELKEFMDIDERLGSTELKRELKSELENKIKSQNEILRFLKNKDLEY